MPKINIPFGENGEDNYTDEAQYLSTLIYKKDKTSSGTATYTSSTSKKIYSTDDYPDDTEIYNKGEVGLIHIFWKLYGGKDGFLELADDANTYIRPSLTDIIDHNEEIISYVTGDKFDKLKEQVEDNTNIISSHVASTVNSENGSHGLRYYDEKLQYKNNDDDWIDIDTTEKGLSPSNVSDLKAIKADGSLTIYWSDPEDTLIDDHVVCTWKGTKLVQKLGAFPENITDGILLVDNQVRNKYKENGFIVSGLTNGETYYFALFPYSDTGAINMEEKNRVSATPMPYKTMTVLIDTTNSDPTSSVTYADDAINMTAGSSDWDEFFGHYPVLFSAGEEVGRLNPDNFAQFEDGTTADISSGSAGDVMIAFPMKGIRIKTIGDILSVSMTEDPDNADFKYYAHTRGSERKEVFYLGAYKGYVSSSKLRSLKGQTPTASNTISTFRTYAQNNGTGYEQSGFYQLVFRQVMYLLKYKTLDSQTAVGYGYANSSNSKVTSTGGTETWGMDCENIKSTNPTYMTDGTHHVKLFGIEDAWGNINEWIDGCVTDASYNILTATDSFNDSGSGYTNQGQGATANISGYISKVQGTTETAFIAKECSGSQTTYYCDSGDVCASRVANCGGYWDSAGYAGAFRLNLYYASSGSISYVGARVMYL